MKPNTTEPFKLNAHFEQASKYLLLTAGTEVPGVVLINNAFDMPTLSLKLMFGAAGLTLVAIGAVCARRFVRNYTRGHMQDNRDMTDRIIAHIDQKIEALKNELDERSLQSIRVIANDLGDGPTI